MSLEWQTKSFRAAAGFRKKTQIRAADGILKPRGISSSTCLLFPIIAPNSISILGGGITEISESKSISIPNRSRRRRQRTRRLRILVLRIPRLPLATIHPKTDEKALLVAFFKLMNPRPDGRGWRGAILYFGKNAFGFLWIIAGDQQNVIQFNPCLARILDFGAIGLQPVSECGGSLLLGVPERGVPALGQPRQRVGIHLRGGSLFLRRQFIVLNFLPIIKKLPPSQCNDGNYCDGD